MPRGWFFECGCTNRHHITHNGLYLGLVALISSIVGLLILGSLQSIKLVSHTHPINSLLSSITFLRACFFLCLFVLSFSCTLFHGLAGACVNSESILQTLFLCAFTCLFPFVDGFQLTCISISLMLLFSACKN